jgi:uncharacterized SAM-binding protein YcdF (DUF218 family)
MLESRSRNTYENALFGKEVAQPKPGEKWVLVTSALSMPRAVGCFSKVGWTVVPYPAGHIAPANPLDFSPDVLSQFEVLSLALHEWIGMAAYKLTNRM